MGRLVPGTATGGPGMWSQDRVEQVHHFRNWTYVACHTICSVVAQLMPNIAYAVDPDELEPGHHYQKYNSPHANFHGSRAFHIGGLAVRTPYRKAITIESEEEFLDPAKLSDPLRKLLRKPNAYDTTFDYLYESQLFLELCGVNYTWVVPNALGMPCEMWVVPAHWVFPQTSGGLYDDEDPDAERIIHHYEVRPWGGVGTAGTIRIPPNEMLVERWKSPYNKMDGYGTLSAVAQWIDQEEAISRSRWSQSINTARPEFWVELAEGYEDPDDPTIARIEARFLERFMGEANYGKPFFSPPGAKVTPLSFNPSEMAYYQSEEQIRDMILSAKNVPKSAVGISGEMTFGAILATLVELCTFGINPRLAMRGQSMTRFFDQYYSTGSREVRIWWDDCSPPDPQQLNSDIQADWGCLAITPNEIRKIRGREEWDHGGDEPMAAGPGGLMPYPFNKGEDLSEWADIIKPITQPEPEGGEGGDMAALFGDGGAGGEGDLGGARPDVESPGNVFDLFPDAENTPPAKHADARRQLIRSLLKQLADEDKCQTGPNAGKPGPCPDPKPGDAGGDKKPKWYHPANLARTALRVAQMSAPVSFVADQLMAEAGYSERVRTATKIFSVIGDNAVPFVPAGSAATIILAVYKKPSIAPRLAKAAVAEVVKSMKESARQQARTPLVHMSLNGNGKG